MATFNWKCEVIVIISFGIVFFHKLYNSVSANLVIDIGKLDYLLDNNQTLIFHFVTFENGIPREAALS